MRHSSAFFGGSGIGLLIGLLIGMTTLGVVGILIGTLATILLAYTGNKEEDSSQSKAVRIGAFGLFCVIGILSGLYLRVTDAFVPSPAAKVSEWMRDSVFTKEEAKTYYIYDRFAFVPEGRQIDTLQDRKSSRTVLYGAEASQSDCDKLEEYETFDVANKLDAYDRLGGVWSKRIARIKQLSTTEAEQQKMLELLKGLCDE